MLNQQIGPYKIIAELGEGGMAMVYLAEKGALGKQVAIKVLKKEFLYNQHIRGRFLSEAKKMINLNHPNIVGVQDLIDDGDFIAIELEYIEGKTLKQHLNDHGALPDDEIERLFKQMLDAVGYIHAKGYIHRDIKPSNFMLTESGIIKLTDFGIAKNADDANMDYTGTGTGMQMGTPKYMSPEQVRSSKDVDHRSDIYSLGVVLWEMVTGKVPYDIETESTFDVFRKIVDEPLEPTDTRWDKVIEKCTNKKIENRYQNVEKIDTSELNEKFEPIEPGLSESEQDENNDRKYGLKQNLKVFVLASLIVACATIAPILFFSDNKPKDQIVTQEQHLPEWKIDFEERWEDAVSIENMNNSQNNHDNFSELLTILPEEAEEERNRVQLKLIDYGGFQDPRDGKVYKTVKIGDQVWMAENLNTQTFRNGDMIKEAKSEDDWRHYAENEIPAWCYYRNDGENGKKYGRLYNWYAVSDSRGLSPNGWHVPKDVEWTVLTDFLIKNGHSGKEGTVLKATTGWKDNGNGTDDYDFKGLPGGSRLRYGLFYDGGFIGFWWSSTEKDKSDAWFRELDDSYPDVYRDISKKWYYLSVRCLKD